MAVDISSRAALIKQFHEVTTMATTDEQKRAWAILALQGKAQELGRPPLKGDFDDATRSRIKAFLGPWPRALETAGLKERKTPNAD